LDENLLARSRILGIAGDDRKDSGSEHDNETAHPTVSVAIGNMLAQTAVTISPIGCVNHQKDLLAKPNLKRPRLFMGTPLAH
jgi:hypothetical protein